MLGMLENFDRNIFIAKVKLATWFWILIFFITKVTLAISLFYLFYVRYKKRKWALQSCSSDETTNNIPITPQDLKKGDEMNTQKQK